MQNFLHPFSSLLDSTCTQSLKRPTYSTSLSSTSLDSIQHYFSSFPSVAVCSGSHWSLNGTALSAPLLGRENAMKMIRFVAHVIKTPSGAMSGFIAVAHFNKKVYFLRKTVNAWPSLQGTTTPLLPATEGRTPGSSTPGSPPPASSWSASATRRGTPRP